MVRCFLLALVIFVALPAAGEPGARKEAWFRDLLEATKTGTCKELLRHLERGKKSENYALGLTIAGNALAKCWCGPKNVSLAITLYRKAAALGSRSARVHLGRIYFLGMGVPRDAEKAQYWFRGAVLSLMMAPEAQWLNGVTSKWTTDSANERAKEALNWMRGLAASGPEKRMEIAQKLINGDGVPPDPEAASDWIESAVDDGLPAAELIFEKWMIDGRVREVSKGNGVKLLRKTAGRDYLPAMIELARRLEFGDGIQRDQVSAYSWLLRAGWRGAAIDDALQRVGNRLSAKEKERAVEIAQAPYL